MPDIGDSLEPGVDFDGLRVEEREDGYVFATPEIRRDGLDGTELQELASEYPEYVSNWHYFARELEVRGAGTDFLRWVERAGDLAVPDRYDALREGITRTWGELAITVSLDGTRRYDLRHEADRDADLHDLDRHDDPLDARGIAKFDADGQYRPLKTAPSLVTGWVFPDLSGGELLDAVDFIYPATVDNWHREREGDLDVTHWQETTERQTGLYDVVDDLPRESLSWAVEACCVDSECLKRREWDYAEDDEIDAPRGEGEFPCREPCSLLIAMAREWTNIEREEPRTYEFELTPTEKDAIEGIVDAVADGRIDEIRDGDADDPANRYRARYLRAKHFAGEEWGRRTGRGPSEESGD